MALEALPKGLPNALPKASFWIGRPLALRARAIHLHALLDPRCVSPPKGCGALEHAEGPGGRIDRPEREVLVKARGPAQHVMEVPHPPYGPPAYGLVEGGGVHKHVAYGRGGAGLREGGTARASARRGFGTSRPGLLLALCWPVAVGFVLCSAPSGSYVGVQLFWQPGKTRRATPLAKKGGNQLCCHMHQGGRAPGLGRGVGAAMGRVDAGLASSNLLGLAGTCLRHPGLLLQHRSRDRC